MAVPHNSWQLVVIHFAMGIPYLGFLFRCYSAPKPSRRRRRPASEGGIRPGQAFKLRAVALAGRASGLYGAAMLIFRFLRGLILSIPDGIRGLFRNRYLLRQMIVRDIAQRYRGSMMGLLWSLLTPLLMLAIYTYVFGFVFQARWPIGDGDDKFHFSLLLFSGLIVHGLFSDTVSRAPSLIVSQPNFVKKVVFPLEILPISAIGASLFHTLICIGTLMVFMLITKGAIPWTVPLFPLVLIPMLFHLAGLCWFLASLGVFLRDISQIIGLVMTMVMFTAPIFYPLSAAPVALRNILFLNPLTVPVEALRAVTIYGTQPDWAMLGWYMLAGLLVAVLGHYWFLRTRRAFADVL